MSDTQIPRITRIELIELLNEDLSREVHAVACYANSSKQLSDNFALADSLKSYAEEELSHAMIIAAQIDALGGAPVITSLPASASNRAEELLRGGLDNEVASISQYETRVKQCEVLGEHKAAENIRHIMAQKQEHLGRLVSALGDPGVWLRNHAVVFANHTV